jgi:hypothetical protein
LGKRARATERGAEQTGPGSLTERPVEFTEEGLQ